ncbi:hypothetical protein IAR55_004046 [Kwoniella newhampshirensis]|uniref:Rrn9 domain-containing protein n=1 Tax=Kwoniella newhampshirensis TaxID=1651941 RepID=A0AAW0YYQ2_9TREE
MTAPPRRKINMHLSLPPRMTLSRTDSGDSAPITPGPHTPLPYEFGYFHSGMEAKHLATDLLQLDGSSLLNGVGSKRNREDDDDDDEKVEPEWTEEETDVIQSTLIHPFRPISTHYPPGELPPPNVIDELTNQIIKYAFRRHHSERQFSPTSDCSDEGWTHSWDATRKKLFDTALVESKFGHDAEERKMTREERQHRPGLRRMDSMDFLDQVESEQSNESIGRALSKARTASSRLVTVNFRIVIRALVLSWFLCSIYHTHSCIANRTRTSSSSQRLFPRDLNCQSTVESASTRKEFHCRGPSSGSRGRGEVFDRSDI